MRFLDPIALVYLLLAGWVLFVASVASGELDGTQAVIAAAAGAAGDDGLTIAAAPGVGEGRRVVEVAPGSSAEAIAAQLLAREVLTETGRFSTLLAYTGVSAQLRAGRYEFAPSTPAAEVIRKMRLGLTREVVLVVPEGLRVEEVGDLVVGLGVATAQEWEAALSLPRREPLLRARPEGADLTGYLFPATYPLSEDYSARSASKRARRATRSSSGKPEMWPTKCIRPAASWTPSSSEPMRSPSLWTRYPPTTASMVRRCLIFSISRLPSA